MSKKGRWRKGSVWYFTYCQKFMSYQLINIAARIYFDALKDKSSSTADRRRKLQEMTDAELVLIAKAELPYKTTAFEILLNRYRQKIFGKILSMVKHKEEAYDVMQEVFVKIFNSLPKFEMRSSFSTWIYTITVNTCLNHLEKLQRRPWWWIIDNVEDVQREQFIDESTFLQVETALEQEDTRKRIEEALGQLGEKASQIIRLRYFEEMDYKSIADELGIGLSAAKMRLKRAREEFKTAFEGLGEFA